jgi:GNAT superfamily N-acetyltransferase
VSTTRLASAERIVDFPPVIVTLRNGRAVTVRAIRPEDREAMRAAFNLLSSDARFTRFMAALEKLPGEMLEQAVRPTPGRELALVAVAPQASGDAIVGGARYITDTNREVAEFAVTVIDDWRGLGLGSALLKELVRAARAQGLKVIEGFVLARNWPMLECARRLGFEVATGTDDPGTVLVRLNLRPD